MNRVQGFTLIEMVSVILIVGVLSATALPKFGALSESAELAQANAIAGSMKSAINLVKSVFQSQQNATRVQNLVKFGDGTIDTNNLGYPIGSNKGNGNENVGRGSAGCVAVWNGILTNPPSVAFNNNNASYRSYRHTGNRVCSYVYRDAGDLGNQNTGQLVIKYDSRDGTVVVCGQNPALPSCA